MGTSSETHEDVRVGSPAVEGAARLAAASPSWSASQERSPFPALPDGWSVIGRCRFGTGVPGPHATGCYALAHPKIGVALIDIVPNATPNAEARLRRALTAVEFWPDFPGTLPVVHNRLDAAALRSLPWVLERWFSALPPLTVPGGSAWIEGVRRAMAVDPAWELPGQPKPMPDTPPATARDVGDAVAPRPGRASSRASARPRRWGRLAILPLSFATVFGLGLVSGFLLLESPASVEQPAPAAEQPQSAAVAAPPEAPPKPVEVAAATPAPPPAASAEAPKPVTEAAAAPQAEAAASGTASAGGTAPAVPSSSTARPEPAPGPAIAEAPSPAVPDDPSAMQRVAGLALGAASGAAAQAAPPLETRVSHAVPLGEALPPAPPRAPTPPPVRTVSSQPSSRPSPVIDRACSQALFRFQQGARLTAAEQNFIRTGCSTTRR